MTTMKRKVIGILGVAALAAAAAMSRPAGAVQAKPVHCGQSGKELCCELNGRVYTVDTNFKTNGKEYGCGEDGNWVIVVDEERHVTWQPSLPVLPQVHVAPVPGGVLVQP